MSLLAARGGWRDESVTESSAGGGLELRRRFLVGRGGGRRRDLLPKVVLCGGGLTIFDLSCENYRDVSRRVCVSLIIIIRWLVLLRFRSTIEMEMLLSQTWNVQVPGSRAIPVVRITVHPDPSSHTASGRQELRPALTKVPAPWWTPRSYGPSHKELPSSCTQMNLPTSARVPINPNICSVITWLDPLHACAELGRTPNVRLVFRSTY